jgi:hypothetical protein
MRVRMPAATSEIVEKGETLMDFAS